MGLEIERKFLVRGDGWRGLGETVRIVQGYVSVRPEGVVRVRIEAARALLTLKGANSGLTRSEWEYPIPVADAEQLLAQLCPAPLISKNRTRIHTGALVWEIDEFLDANAGLIIAEIELPTEDHPFARPDWLGEDVSADPRYTNSNLQARPFKSWGASPHD